MGAINPLSLVSLGSNLGVVPGVINAGVQVAAQAGAFGNNRRDEQGLALEQLQQRQALQEKQLVADTELERARIVEQSAINEEQRQSALRRAVARQRARSGASGVSSGGGSAQAVLLGLFDESEDELNARERLDGLRNQALDLNVSNRQSLNVLQRSQLQRRQSFERNLTGFSF